jgi:hypothetical protein
MTLDAFKTNGSSPPECVPDFQLIRRSTIFLLEPLTDAAAGAWIERHVAAGAIRFGPAIVIEHRCITAIVVGIYGDGLRVGS